MLELKQLEFHYPDSKIAIDVSIARGKALAIMGPSGCGKTTTLDLIAGFIKPVHGDIVFKGESLLPLRPAQRPLTYLFQSHNLFPHLTVQQNLAIGIHPGMRISDEDRNQIHLALERVELNGYAERRPDQLSGGQQQRVGLARCLLRNRPLLLLDEPFSALDQALRSDIIGLINQLRANHGFTLILSTHQSEDAKALDASIHCMT